MPDKKKYLEERIKELEDQHAHLFKMQHNFATAHKISQINIKQLKSKIEALTKNQAYIEKNLKANSKKN